MSWGIAILKVLVLRKAGMLTKSITTLRMALIQCKDPMSGFSVFADPISQRFKPIGYKIALERVL